MTAANSRQDHAQSLLAQVKPLLFPHLWGRDERQAVLSEAFYPAHLWVLEQISIDGSFAHFLPHCWRTLAQGAPDGSLNTRLLLTLKARYGADRQREIDDLIVAWQQFCAAQMPIPVTATAGLPAPKAVTDGPGQPALFLSYADTDAALAGRLQVELAAYGYACWRERPPLDKEDERLAATAAGLGNAYAVLLLVGAHTADDRWQRLEYLAALDRHKTIIPVRLHGGAPLPAYLPETAQPVVYDGPSGVSLEELLRHLPLPPPPAHAAWVSQADALRPRLAELLYMDRLKLAELRHVAQYTRLGGQATLRRTSSDRLHLQPVVARQEFHHAPWRQARETVVEQRRFEDAVAELKAIGRAVLLGDPGSGKTTTLYKLAADLIEAALAAPVAPVPLMVRLGLWTDAAEPFTGFLRRSAGEVGEGLEQRLAAHRLALLLDGINEIPAGQQADKYRQVRDFLAGYPTLPAWVSCREQDYPPERDLRLDRVTVALLDAVRVQEFIHNYLDNLPGYGPEAAADLFWQLAGAKAQETHRRFMADLGPKLSDPEHTFWLDSHLPDGLTWGWELKGYENRDWKEWLKERARPDSLLRLATNPYMLFMLLDVYQAYDRTLPANRGQLFDRFVETLLLRERLGAREQTTGQLIFHPAGNALLVGLTALAYEMQRQSAASHESGALTALPLAAASAILTEQQRYQAASANLLTLGDEVRFAHQLLQEYFVARAMRERIWGKQEVAQRRGAQPVLSLLKEAQRLKVAEIWEPKKWWEPTNWEEATILLAGLYSDDCTRVLAWLADAQPELAARCIVESGAFTPEETKLWLRDRWLPRLTDLKREPDARARAAVGRALGRGRLVDGTPLDDRPGVGVDPVTSLPDILWSDEIPAGRYHIGDDRGTEDEKPRTVPIARPYRLACYPITNAQFQCFVEAEDVHDGRWWQNMPETERQFSEPYFPYANHPRETVSWYQAVAFCRWLTARLHAGELPPGPLTGDLTQYEIMLPHEFEWEVAARWSNEDMSDRIYPWGTAFDAAKVNTLKGNRIGQTTAVGIYPHGANPKLNLYDLSGNVREWCRNKYEKPDDDQIDGSGGRRVVRGGSWSGAQDDARAAYRFNLHPSVRSYSGGFRVVVVRRSPSHP